MTRVLEDYAASVRQTVAEWLVLSNNSWFPFAQVSFVRLQREREPESEREINDGDEALRIAGRF